jgi:hypothetical protein
MLQTLAQDPDGIFINSTALKKYIPVTVVSDTNHVAHVGL